MIDILFRNIPLALGFFCIGWSVGDLSQEKYLESAAFLTLGFVCFLAYYRENR